MSAAKWFTRARRFPQIIGQTPNGTKIFGGPYTYTQVFVGGGVLAVLWGTTGLWARSNVLVNAALFVCIVGASVVLAGRIPPGARNPLILTRGLVRVFQYGYRREAKPIISRVANRRFQGSVVIFEDAPKRLETQQPVEEPPVIQDQPMADQPSAPVLSAVQRLLLEGGAQ